MTTSLIPYPLFNYSQLFLLLLPVASLLVAIGLLSSLQRAGSTAEQMQAIVQVAGVVALLAYFGTAVQTGKFLVHRLVEDGLHAKPEELPLKFSQKLFASEPEADDGDFWGKVSKLGTRVFDSILVAAIVLISLAALVFFFLAYLSQELALEIGIGLAPLFVGLLLLPGTRSIGTHFLLFMLAIILVPIGWGVASLVSDKLIDFATTESLAQSEAAAALSYSVRRVFGALLLALWIIGSTLVAPLAMLKAVTTGVFISSEAFRGLRGITGK